jgi:hypothetical protein
LLLGLSVAATAVAALVAATGGFTFHVLGVRVSMRAVTRPTILAVAFGLASLVAYARAGTDREGAERPLSLRNGRVAAVAFAVATGLSTWVNGAHIAGGADQSGYLSQARLWRSGDLRVATPLAHELSLVHGQYAFTPLGYQPAGMGVAVPGYPPGLPLLLAGASAIGGERAQFIVVPLSTAALVLVTFVLGCRLGGVAAGMVAAAAVSGSPTLLFQATQPMSDVPAAFWFTLSVLLLTNEGRAAAAAAGVAAAVGCFIRPNLFVMAPVLAALAWWWANWSRRALLNGVIFLAAPAVAAVMLSLIHRTLFGSVTTSGYGPIESLFSVAHVLPNLARYPRWALFTHSALLAAAVIGPLAIRRHWVVPAIDASRADRIAWSGLLFFAALQVFYLLYLVFDRDDWVSFRFLLPALPWVFALQGIALAALCRLAPPSRRTIAVVLVAILAASWGVGRGRGLGAFRLIHSEERYRTVADFARGRPPDAVFLTVQHSGSLRYYAAATILRWDWIEPDELDRTLAQLAERRRPVFLVLDSFEETQFRERFAATAAVRRLTAPMLATGEPGGVISQVYGLGTTDDAGPAPFNSPPPPAPRDPRMPAAPGRESGAASSTR